MDELMDSQGRGPSCESREEAKEEKPECLSGDEGEGIEGATKTLYVSNLPSRISVAEIRRIFDDVAEVQDCRIVSNPVTRESRGFAFVSLRDPSKLQEAIERLDGKVFPGDSKKPLRIERAKRNRPHQPTPGYYKGPPGASVKYDKSGRLRPGFLPYYAVAPGSSREFPARACGRGGSSRENGHPAASYASRSAGSPSRFMARSAAPSAWLPPMYGFAGRADPYAFHGTPYEFFRGDAFSRDPCRPGRASEEGDFFPGFFGSAPYLMDPRMVPAYEGDRRERLDRRGVHRSASAASREEWNRDREYRGRERGRDYRRGDSGSDGFLDERGLPRDRDGYPERRAGGPPYYDARLDEVSSRRGYGDGVRGRSPGFEGNGGRERERGMRDKSRSRDRGGRRERWRSVSSSPRRRFASRR